MVKRYDLEDTEDGATELVERAHGDWVSFDDYDTVSEELSRLKDIIKEATADIKHALSDLEEA